MQSVVVREPLSAQLLHDGAVDKANAAPLLRSVARAVPRGQETLEVFVLDAGLSSSKAAKLMDVHVNTVQYRLKRIREILGADITSNTIVPGLMMALAVQRIEKEAGPF